ncbi:MAG: hypothetical protein ACJAZJ_001183 [Candidatus Endobugula sp.]|jgi:hypothetical protein
MNKNKAEDPIGQHVMGFAIVSDVDHKETNNGAVCGNPNTVS